MKNIAYFVVVLLVPVVSMAQISRSADVKQNRAFVYTGKLVRPDGTTPTGNLAVSLKIFSPDPSLCLLWAETQTVEVKQGGFSLELGHSVHRLAGSAGGAAADFKQVFVNNSSLTIPSAQCASGTSYTPTSVDDRLLTAAFNDSGTVVEIAGLPIKSVPFALQAEEIAGFGIANLAKISGTGSSVTYTPAEVQTLKDMLGGDVFFDMKSRVVKNVAAPTTGTDATNKTYVDNAITAAVVAAGAGTVTNVSVAGGALAVSSGSTTPLITLAQANGSTNGYLSSADWTTFNNKQGALGFTPVSNALTTGQVYLGVAGVATASNFGIGQMRNNVGTLQFPTACAASQTLTWSAVTDVLVCSNIDGLNADKITAGTLATARLGSGTADATKYLRGDGTWQTLPSGADNLGNHTATQNLNLAGFQLVGNGGSSGLAITNAGNVGLGTTSPGSSLTGAGKVFEVSAGTIFNNASGPGEGIILGKTGVASKYSLWVNPNDALMLVEHGMGKGLRIENSGNVRIYANNYSATSAGVLDVDGLLVVKSSGNVGIGTASPNHKLDVAGDINITGNFKINGTNIATGGGTITALTGDVTASGTGSVGATVASVGGSTAANVNTATVAVNTNATAASTASVLVKRDASGDASFKHVKLDGATSGTITIGAADTTTPYAIKFPAGIAGTNNSVLASDTSGNLSWINLGSVTGNINLTSQVTGVLPIANGGTNSSATLNGNRLMVSSGTAIVEAGAMTNGQIVVGSTGAAPAIVTMGGDATINNTGSVTVGKINNTTVSGVGLANNNLLQNNSGSAISGNSVLVSNGTATGVTALTTPVSGVLISTGGSVPTWASISTDTFTQYALLAGRGAGQTLNGGANASGSLTLDSTANGTKGNIVLGPTGGNVGIGTTTPAQALHIATSVAAGNTVALVDNSAVTGGYGAMVALKNSARGYNIGTVGAGNGFNANGAFAILDANAPAWRMVIDHTGNMGIGTTTPSTTLEVAGTATVQASVEAAAASVNAGGAYTIPDLTKNIRRVGLNTASNTITLPVTTGLATDMAYSLTIRVKQDASGSRALTWASGANSIKWDSGSTPAVATSPNTETIYQFMIIGGETVWYASQVWKEN